MAQLLDLPYEVLNHILREVDPSTIASLSRCCKDFHRMITDNSLLFRSLYLSILVSIRTNVVPFGAPLR